MTKGAILIERRLDVDINQVIDNHFRYLDNDWQLAIYGPNEVLQMVDDTYNPLLFELPKEVFNCYEDYNKLLTSGFFWRSVPFEKTLIFHPDSMLLREGINDFLHFDYIGAPWGHFEHVGGNGGLSIRTTAKMLDVIKRVKYDIKKHGNEDLYFSKFVHQFGGNVAPKEIAMKFSVETIFYPTPIGVHAPEKYLTKDQLDILFTSNMKNINVNDVTYD